LTGPVQPTDPRPGGPEADEWPGKLIIRYTDGTVTEEFFREAPDDYALHLSMLDTVDCARVEISLGGRSEWREYHDGARTGQAP
jgi:hypothetical protein